MLALLSILNLLCGHRSKPGADYMHYNKHSGRYAQSFGIYYYLKSILNTSANFENTA